MPGINEGSLEVTSVKQYGGGEHRVSGVTITKDGAERPLIYPEFPPEDQGPIPNGTLPKEMSSAAADATNMETATSDEAKIRTEFVNKFGVKETPGIIIGKNRTAAEITEQEKMTVANIIGQKTGSSDQVANYYAAEKQLMDEVITRPFDGFTRLPDANALLRPVTADSLKIPVPTEAPIVVDPTKVDSNPKAVGPAAPVKEANPAPTPVAADTPSGGSKADNDNVEEVLRKAAEAWVNPAPVETPVPAPTPTVDAKNITSDEAIQKAADSLLGKTEQEIRDDEVAEEAQLEEHNAAQMETVTPDPNDVLKPTAEKKRGFFGRLKDKINNRVNSFREAIKKEFGNIKAEDQKRLAEKADKAESKAAAKLNAIEKDASDKAASATATLKAKIGSGPFDVLIEGVSIVAPAILLAPAVVEKGIAKVFELGQKFRADLQEMDAQDKEMRLLKMNEGDKGESRLAQAAGESRKKAIALKDAAGANKAKIEKFRLINRAMNAMYRRVA